MIHYWIIGGGMVLGIIVLNFLNKYETPKQKVKIEDNQQTESEQSNLKKESDIEPEKKLENNETEEQLLTQRKIEAQERKNKLFKNLSKEDREMVEEFFQQKAKQYVTGQVDPSERRTLKLINFIKFTLYALFAGMVYLGLTRAFNTNSPMMILENIKFLVQSFLQQLFKKQ